VSGNVNAVIAEGINPLAQASQQTDIQTKQFALQQAQLQPAYQAMRQVMATNPNPSWDDVNYALGQSKRIGGNVNGLVANAQETAAKGGNAADFMRANALGGMSPWEQGALAGPQQQQFHTAAGTVYGTIGGPWSASAGTFQPGGFVAQGLSPEQWAQPAIITDPKTGQQTEVPFGQKWGIPAPPGVGGPGGGGDGATGATSSQPASGPPPGSDIKPGTTLSPKDADLARFAQRESGNQNIFSNVKVPGYTQEQTGSGYYQIIPSTWAEGKKLAGIEGGPDLAIKASPQMQYQVASALYDKYGGKPWAQSASTVPQPGPFIGATTAEPVQPSRPAQGFQSFSPTGQPLSSPSAQGPPGMPRSYALPPPGLVPSIEAAADVSTKQYAADNAAAGQFNQRLWPLVNAQHILETQGTTTGPGAAAARDVIGHLQTLASVFTPADFQNIGQAKFEELNKYLVQAVNAQPFSQQSDARLASAITGNPSAHITTMANQDILKAMIGLERMKQAAITDFNNQGGQPMNYANFLRQWQTTHDPRAFVFDMMSQDERTKMANAMTPNERTNFANTLTLVQNNPGLLTRAAMP
jgi:hypothetical protein